MTHAWPQAARHAVAALRSAQGLTVIRIATPDTEIRHAARAHTRATVRDLLAALLHQPAATLPLVSQPGQALRLDQPGTHIGLSVSHAPGLSVAAVHRHGAVGVDVMRVGEDADGMPDWETVARDYLGPAALHRMAQVTPGQRALAFAHAWTVQEARLKCLGLALAEWSPALEQRLATCTVTALDLPPGWCGAVAVPNDQGNQSSACM